MTLDALANSLQCVLRQAQHERYFSELSTISVRPELVEGRICEGITLELEE